MRRIACLALVLPLLSACRSGGVDYLESVPPLIVDMTGVDGFVPPDDGFVPPDDGFVPPDDRFVPPPDDGFVPPPDRFVPDDGFVVFDFARDGSLPPPVDLARDAFQPDLPDFGLPDIFVPDLGSVCVAGRHTGPLTGAIAGFPMNGTFDFTLGQPAFGILPVIAGTMVATGPGNSTFNATLSGALDCGNKLLTGTIDNGVVGFNGQRFAYSGVWNGVYAPGGNNFVNGTWLITVPQSPLGQLSGNGTWTSN